MLVYNIKRSINILGVPDLIAKLQAWNTPYKRKGLFFTKTTNLKLFLASIISRTNQNKFKISLAKSKDICVLIKEIVEKKGFFHSLTFRRLARLHFGTDYFLLKIKFLAKREREFTTKFAIAPNVCWQMPFFFLLSFYILFCRLNNSDIL